LEASATRISDEIDLKDAVRRPASRWKLLLAAFICGSLAAFFYSRALPKTYETKATVFVQQNSLASGLLKDIPVALGGSQGSASGYYVSLLQSETMLRRVYAALRLSRFKEFAGGSPELEDIALKRLRANIFINENKNGGIDIVVRASSPFLAADIANSILDNLGSLVVTSSKRKADFIADKLEETSRKLKAAEDSLLRFQERNDFAGLDSATQELVTRLSDLDAKLLMIDMDLQQTGSELANAGKIEQLVELEVKKRSLESSRSYLEAKRAQLQSQISKLPLITTQYARLQRRVALLSKTFELLTEQYQLASISQHGEGGDYQVIDRARPMRKPVLPKTMLNTAIGGMSGFVIAASALALSNRPTHFKRKRLR